MNQNACLMVTTEEDGITTLTYIPLSLSTEELAVIAKIGSDCSNKVAVTFDLDIDANTLWKNMWEELDND